MCDAHSPCVCHTLSPPGYARSSIWSHITGFLLPKSTLPRPVITRIPLSHAKPPLYVRTHVDCSWATVFPPLVSPGVPLLSYTATESWIPQSHRALVNLSPLPPLSHCTSPPLSLMWLKPTPHVFLEHSPHANFPAHRSP